MSDGEIGAIPSGKSSRDQLGMFPSDTRNKGISW